MDSAAFVDPGLNDGNSGVAPKPKKRGGMASPLRNNQLKNIVFLPRIRAR
jgi:hypothetical protein